MSVVVTGIGVVSPLGLGIHHVWSQILAKRSAIVHLGNEYKQFPSQIGGKIPIGNLPEEWDSKRYFASANLKRLPLFCQYALAASRMALNDACYEPQRLTKSERRRVGVAVGSGIGGIDAAYENSVALHNHGYKKVSPYFVPNLLVNMVAGHISIETGLTGPNHSVSTACTTGAHSIGDAANFIKLGYADVMIAGSSEACLHPISVAGFGRARSLATEFNDSPKDASRPFDSKRCGFVIAEGAAIMILESEEHALRRNAKIYAKLEGYGLSADAYHVTAPHSQGEGAFNAMKMAIERARISPSEVGYVNAHATSTLIGDDIEAKAIERIFSVNSPLANEKSEETKSYVNESRIAVSSTKGATGHLLGASGSLEAAFTVMALSESTIPPTLNLESTNIDADVDFVKESRYAPNLKYALTNSFGFGGTNASLLFKKYNP